MKKIFKTLAVVLIIAFAAIQIVRADRTNPPVNAADVLQAPPDVQAILDRSCADCHSSNTRWPWYTNVAPVSWWIADHVKDGRKEMSFSEFNTYSPKKAAHKMEEICEQLKKGEMPLKGYTPLHPEAKLTDADKQRLCEWSSSERARILTAMAPAVAPSPAESASEASSSADHEANENEEHEH